MNNTYEVCLVSDSTGETLDRIFLALKAQFKNTKYKTNQYSFTRTENQILKIIDICKKKEKPIILLTIFFFNFINFYYRCCSFFNRFSCDINCWPIIFFK